MIDELKKLIEYAESKGNKVSIVTDGQLNDYAGMNPQAAEVMGYDDIDHNEILIDGKLSLETQVNNLRHEIIEKNLMKSGMKYYPAHVVALKLENVELSGDELDKLEKIGSYDVAKISNAGIIVNSNGVVYNIKSKDKELYVMPEKKDNIIKKMFKKSPNKFGKSAKLVTKQ